MKRIFSLLLANLLPAPLTSRTEIPYAVDGNRQRPVMVVTRATLWLAAGCILAGCAMAGAAQSEDGVFRTTISPVTEAQHGQWNVALTELPAGRVLAIWEVGHTEVKTPNVIMSSLSEDGGRTWGERREFYRRPGMRCTPCGFYRVKGLLHCMHAELPMAGGKEPCRVLVRASSDGGASWTEGREVWRTQFGVAMQPVVLRDGRIALPVYYRDTNSSGTVTSISRVLVSKDDGATWQEGTNIPADLPGGAMEPALAETSDGDWLCVIRTRGTGWLYASRSKDSGLTWATPAPLPLESPESIARLRQLDDGSIIVVWNGVASKTQGPRDRLTVARSVDGGRTWPQRRDLVRGGPVFSNHGVMQASDGRILIGYQHFHRDPVRAPERSGVDSVDLASFDLPWLAARAEMPYAVDRNGQRPVPVVTAPGHCAWPNLKLLKDGRTLAALIFNDASHGHHPGDIECWLSGDGGATWKFGSAATQHEPDTIRMNHAAGLAANGDLIVLTSGWSNRWPPNVKRTRGSYRYEVLGPWLSRSPDGGKSWWVSKDAFPQTVPSGQPAVPFGDVQTAKNGDLCVAVYSTQGPWEKYEERKFRSWLYRSKDDGKTWGEPVVIGPDANETTPLHLGNGRWLACARVGSGVEKKDQLLLFASADDGRTWTFKRTMTGFQRVNGHLAKLRDGRVLFTYGDRASDFGKKGLEAMMSADGGETWTEPVRLTDWNGLDGGYPSSVQRTDGQIITAYYSSALPGDPPDSYKNYHMAVIVWDAEKSFPKR